MSWCPLPQLLCCTHPAKACIPATSQLHTPGMPVLPPLLAAPGAAGGMQRPRAPRWRRRPRRWTWTPLQTSPAPPAGTAATPPTTSSSAPASEVLTAACMHAMAPTASPVPAEMPPLDGFEETHALYSSLSAPCMAPHTPERAMHGTVNEWMDHIKPPGRVRMRLMHRQEHHQGHQAPQNNP